MRTELVASASPVNIMMIEDDEGHARLIEKHIRRAGVDSDISGFRDGASALAHLFRKRDSLSKKKEPPSVILLDLNLPDMTGIDILQAVKRDEHLRRLPVIVLTSTDDPRELERCYDLGANICITKPLNDANFANAIRQLGQFLSVIVIPEID
jgi:CheY-like chemotaxis protein